MALVSLSCRSSIGTVAAASEEEAPFIAGVRFTIVVKLLTVQHSELPNLVLFEL